MILSIGLSVGNWRFSSTIGEELRYLGDGARIYLTNLLLEIERERQGKARHNSKVEDAGQGGEVAN